MAEQKVRNILKSLQSDGAGLYRKHNGFSDDSGNPLKSDHAVVRRSEMKTIFCFAYFFAGCGNGDVVKVETSESQTADQVTLIQLQNQLAELQKTVELLERQIDMMEDWHNYDDQQWALHQGCELGHVDQCLELGHNYNGIWRGKRYQELAFVVYEQACEGGLVEGCFGAGALINGSPPPELRDESRLLPDVPRALAFFRKGCSGGSGNACLALGSHYSSNDGVDANEKTAQSYFQKACDAGENVGCLSVSKPTSQ